LTVSLLPTDDTDILGMDPIGPLAPLEGQKPLLHCAAGVAAVIYAQSLESESEEFELDEATVELAQSVTQVQL
jgi:hypothetical protein